MSETPSYQRLFAELKRRNVFRVAAVYGATAFVIIEASDLVFPRIPLPEWTIALVVWLALLGLPLALALAWAYERTSEGLKATDPAATAELDAIARQPRRSRWPAGIAAIAGVALLALGAWWTLARTGPGTRSYDSIAVLPFANMSGDPDNQYFSDGLADELINALAGVADLKVAGRTSSFALRDQNLDLRTIGDTLDVEAVLEGSVRRSEDRVRITAQLIDARTGFDLWSEEYDRDITDIFVVQEELAQSIVRALIPRLGGDADPLYRGGTSDIRAYELYVAGRQKWYTRRLALMWDAVDEFEEAVARDPEFALGWSGLADVIDALAFRDARAQPMVPRAIMAAQRAVLLDPELAEGWASWGVLASEADQDWTTAELALKKAIALKPSYAYARAMLGDMLRYQGRIKEAIEQHRLALALDPLSPVIHGVLGMSLVAARQYGEGRAQVERTLATGGDPEFAHAAFLLWGRLMGLSGEGMASHAVYLARSLGAPDPDIAAVIGHALASDGTDEELLSEARGAVATLVADSVFTVRQITVLYTSLGDHETALQWIDSAAGVNDLSLGLLGIDPALDPLRDDPRMQRLMDELGLPNGYDPAADTYEPQGGP
jgi:TolB-like protein/tetratricopeptide (TPR) repeat protein